MVTLDVGRKPICVVEVQVLVINLIFSHFDEFLVHLHYFVHLFLFVNDEKCSIFAFCYLDRYNSAALVMVQLDGFWLPIHPDDFGDKVPVIDEINITCNILLKVTLVGPFGNSHQGVVVISVVRIELARCDVVLVLNNDLLVVGQGC